MLKLLIDFFGWVPVLGQSMKIAYISARAYEVANKIKMDDQKANLQGEELEKHISDTATSAYEEHLKPEVDKLGLPEAITDKAGEKAIEIISQKAREKYQNRVA